MDANEADAAGFMLEEYKDCYENIMHLENKLFSHLSLYTTLFLGLVTASNAIVQLGGTNASSTEQPAVWSKLLPLVLAFVFVSRFELRMTTELRVRKIKFVEAITQVRQYFVERDHPLSDCLVLPVGLKKAPPYLRARSHDWYHVLYLSLMNGLAILAAWACALSWLRDYCPRPYAALYALSPPLFQAAAVLLGVLLGWVVFWELSYKSVQEVCQFYDGQRVKRMGAASEYELLKRPMSKNLLRRSFGDWIWIIESRGKCDKTDHEGTS